MLHAHRTINPSSHTVKTQTVKTQTAFHSLMLLHGSRLIVATHWKTAEYLGKGVLFLQKIVILPKAHGPLFVFPLGSD